MKHIRVILFYSVLITGIILSTTKASLANPMDDLKYAINNNLKITPSLIRSAYKYLAKRESINELKTTIEAFLGEDVYKERASKLNTANNITTGLTAAFDIVSDVTIDALAHNNTIKTDPYIIKLGVKTIKNLVLHDLTGAVLDDATLVWNSWEDTNKAFTSLPPSAVTYLDPDSQRFYWEAMNATAAKESGDYIGYVETIIGSGGDQVSVWATDTAISSAYAIDKKVNTLYTTFNNPQIGIKVIKDYNYLITEGGLLNIYNYSTSNSSKGSIHYISDWSTYKGSWVDTFDFASKETVNHMDYYNVKEYYNGTQVKSGNISVYTRVNDEYNYLIWGGWGESLKGDPVLGGGAWIIGDITSNVPKSGTAHYSGSIIGFADREINGSVALTANFGSSSLSGTLNCKYRDDGKNFANAQLSNVVIGTPDPSAFLGSLTGSNIARGSIGGAFFGPKAQEIGGYWNIQKTDGNNGHGIFVAK